MSGVPTSGGEYPPGGLALPAGTITNTTNAYNVRVYGAKGDGATDDTAAVARAVAAANTAGGGTVYFPQGTYLLTGTVSVGANTRLLGDCRGASVIANGGGNIPIFAATSKDSIAFEHLTLQDNSAPLSGTLNGLVNLTTCTNTRFFACRFTGMQGSAILCGQCVDLTIDSCRFDHSGTGRASARFIPAVDTGTGSTKSSRVKIIGCHFESLDFTAIWLQADDSEVIGCSFYTIGEAVINNNGLRNRYIGNYCEGTYLVSLDTYFIESYGDDAIIADNTILSAGQLAAKYGATGGAGGLFIGGGGAVVTGNRVNNCFNYGIVLCTNNNQSSYHGANSGINITCKDNIVTGCGQGGAQDGGLFTNVVGPKSFVGLVIEGNCLSGNSGTKALYLPNAGDSGVLIASNPGHNPRGRSVYQMGAMPASGTAWVNNTGYSVDMYLSGGTVTGVSRKDLSGNTTQVATATPCMVHLEPGEAVIITYSVQPSAPVFGY